MEDEIELLLKQRLAVIELEVNEDEGDNDCFTVTLTEPQEEQAK